MCYQVETCYKEKEFEVMSQSQGQRVPGLKTEGGNTGVEEACATHSSRETMSLGSPVAPLTRSCTQETSTEPE